MPKPLDTIQTVLRQSRMLSQAQISQFVAYAQAQPLDVLHLIAQALSDDADAENFVRNMDSEIGRIGRATRTRNLPLLQKYLDCMNKKVAYACMQIDNEVWVVDTKKRIQDIYASGKQ